MTSAVGLHHSSYAAMIVVLMARDTCELCQVTTPVSTFIQVPRMMLLSEMSLNGGQHIWESTRMSYNLEHPGTSLSLHLTIMHAHAANYITVLNNNLL